MEKDPTPTPPDPNQIDRPKSGLSAFWSELKRRHVMRVAMMYVFVGWLVIQVAGTTFSKLSIPIWAESLVIMLVILGFPISLVVAWAFELTPEGVRTSKSAQEKHPDSHKDPSHAKKRSWLAHGVGAAVPTLIFSVLALVFYIRSSGEVQVVHEDKSIAVLPFDNRSERKEDEFFTDGIHDDLLTHISRIRDIKTISRTSVMGYRDTTKHMPTIGEELGVAHILEGGIQRAGSQIRINVQLIDAAADEHIWAKIYTRQMTAENIFQIQSEIAEAIAGALKAVLSPEEMESMERLPTQNLAALEAYFRGRESHRPMAASGKEETIAHYEKAISLDPDFASPHASLGMVLLGQISIAGLPREQQIAKAEAHILRALELDGTLSEAHSALGFLKQRQGDLDGAELAYQKAIELNPNNADAYWRYGLFLRNAGLALRGDLEEPIRMIRKANELDPNSDDAPRRLAYAYESSGQLDEARKLREELAERNPTDARAQYQLGRFYLRFLRRDDDAIVALRRANALDVGNSRNLRGISDAYFRLGDTDQAVWWVDRFLEIEQDPVVRADWKAWKFELTGNDDAREKIALEGLKADPRRGSLFSNFLLSHLTDLYIASGHPGKARARWEAAYPSLFEPSAEVGLWMAWRAKDVARVLMATGEQEQAKHLIKEALAAVKPFYSPIERLRLEADLYAVAGDDRQALDAIRRYLDAGGSPWDIMGSDELKPFENDPEYREMAAKREAELAVQLKRIREMEANGELAPIPPLPSK